MDSCYITIYSHIYNMRKNLIETLTKHATDIDFAQGTNSVYFIINNLKVRVFDYHSDNSDCDLVI